MASTATTFDTDCVLMLHMDGADASTTFTDSSFTNTKTMTAQGNAQIDTAQSKFGGASGLFDGTGDYLTTGDSGDWDFGTGDFTVDFWVRYIDFTNGIFQAVGNGFVAGWQIFSYNGGNFTVYFQNVVIINAAPFVYAADTWYHFALTRSGTSLKAFANGTSFFSGSDSTNISGSTNSLAVGDDPVTHSYAMHGWLEEVRIVKGTAVWTANFTPPTAAYARPSSAKPSKMMLMGIG